eukprot:1532148-Prorocentrum_lima.AAC.1
MGDGHETWLCNGTESDHASAHMRSRESSYRMSLPFKNMVGQRIRTIYEEPTTHVNMCCGFLID